LITIEQEYYAFIQRESLLLNLGTIRGFVFVDFVLLSLVSFYFVFISLISFRFVSFLLISFRFVSFSFLFRFALYRCDVMLYRLHLRKNVYRKCNFSGKIKICRKII
jgi:hypothetical protein